LAAKTRLRVGRPLELQPEQRDLRRMREDEVPEAHLAHVAVRALNDGLQRALHALHQTLQPHLHHACVHAITITISPFTLIVILIIS
jgi:hypothetical protein